MLLVLKRVFGYQSTGEEMMDESVSIIMPAYNIQGFKYIKIR